MYLNLIIANHQTRPSGQSYFSWEVNYLIWWSKIIRLTRTLPGYLDPGSVNIKQ